MLFCYEVPVLNFQLHHQTLKIDYSQSAFEDNFKKPKHDNATLFYYGVLEPIIRFHHQTLKVTHNQTTFQNNFNKLKREYDALLRYGVPVSTFSLHR
ncbi:hypothetical protein EVAR_15869_1 [Eumeta japonica]|uniref:Uncharacterized protein n=1 Tax=Eumeta variegata TaxID=151549 RepID=A0A4C1UDW4_EUMVA|nr:hypothetical protein EVAR_15869_1 [Eumeta japonica]